MRTRQKSAFQKVGECLYRYSSNGVYYARFESSGKEIRRSLRTTDRTSAQRALTWLKQEREQVDPTQSKLTRAELSDRYAATIQHQAPKTIERKLLIIHRISRTGQPAGLLRSPRFDRRMSICGCPGIILVQPHAISSSPASRKSSRSRYAIESSPLHPQHTYVTQSARSGFVPHRALKSSKQSSKPSARRNTTGMMHKRARISWSFSGWLG
jgi:hypothetical protein